VQRQPLAMGFELRMLQLGGEQRVELAQIRAPSTVSSAAARQS
jgi:hypothetical protein